MTGVDRNQSSPPKRRHRRRQGKGIRPLVSPPQKSVGLLVTAELEIATNRCRERVLAISRECRANNRKFRDYDWDIQNDKDLCLMGCVDPEDMGDPFVDASDKALNPSDVLRVSNIFDNPEFFKDGASSSDIEQGVLGDCWFLSALSTLATVPGLMDRICVERDEAVGVYGFIFFRDGKWVDVVIDDLLFVANPKFAELKPEEQRLYHFDLDAYNATARKGRKALYFARSTTEGETWVPLIEKAYAKLHGDYLSLSGGSANEAIEDLTGGVCNSIPIIDILDTDYFWKDLQDQIRRNHLFGCFLPYLSNQRNGLSRMDVHGLFPSHAYSILKAADYKGKRFVLIRNPWGKGEWTGKWSDGSSEWTSEWQGLHEVLDHQPGDDGVFVMEYTDFLKHWGTIERTRLFDETWVASSYWLSVRGLRIDRAWSYGDVSWTFTIPEATPAVIVLQQVDNRYFRQHCGWIVFHFDFVLFKKGSKQPLARPVRTDSLGRSVILEIQLEPGEYVVHARIDRNNFREKDWYSDHVGKWDRRKVLRQRGERALAYSVASNFRPEDYEDDLPIPLEVLGDRNVMEVGIEVVEAKRHQDIARNALIDAHKAEKKAKEEDKGDKNEDKVATESKAGAGEEEKVKDNDDTKKENKDDENEEDHEEKKDDDDAAKTEDDKTNESEAGGKGEAEDGNSSDSGSDGADHDGPIKIGDHEIEEESDVPDHEFVRCDGCGVSPVKGPRFKCIDARCPDYDLCEDCKDAGVHPPEHHLLHLETPEDANKFIRDEGSRDDDEDPPLVIGLRVYTNKNSPASVEGFLSRIRGISRTA